MQLPRKMAGRSKGSFEWNRMVDYLRAITPIGGPGIRVSQTPAGSAIATEMRRKGPGTAGGGTSIYQAVVQSWTSSNDYVSVKLATYDESGNSWDVSGDAFNAALPHLQRQDIVTALDNDHGDANILLWPPYAADDVVLITQPQGGTGVEVSSADLAWMILPNVRTWCMEFEVCTASDKFYSIMPTWALSDASNGSFTTVD